MVTLTLDGADVSFADLKDKTGDAVLTVTYQQQAAMPILAVTVLPLPEEGITAVSYTHLDVYKRQIIHGIDTAWFFASSSISVTGTPI